MDLSVRPSYRSSPFSADIFPQAHPLQAMPIAPTSSIAATPILWEKSHATLGADENREARSHLTSLSIAQSNANLLREAQPARVSGAITTATAAEYALTLRTAHKAQQPVAER